MKRNVKVSERRLRAIDERAGESEVTARPAVVREVLRDTTDPGPTPWAQEGVSEGDADGVA